ncbi:MAG: transcriptional regulator [Bacteroidia bacterium]|nr:MAG: transcriptional regulator [Bacteroidia bacterium]
MTENKTFDKKALTFLKGRNTDWNELAKDCVCFANAQGGVIAIGIEDDSSMPDSGQKIVDKTLPDIVQKAIGERTTHVSIAVSIVTAKNGGEYLRVEVFRNIQTIAATTDGRYYIRVSDHCRPVPPDEMARLAADKNAFIWEEQTTRNAYIKDCNLEKKQNFLDDLRKSSRVSNFVKEKSDDEILEYYFLKSGELLTNLGILWIGTRSQRAGLLYPPAIQVIRYNDREEKVWKLTLDDYRFNPKELLEAVMEDTPDWQESVEVSDGLFRTEIPVFPYEVVRELLVNALAHRSYTTRGDIFINIFFDRMEVHSPGNLPYGVTPSNILSQSIRRNEKLSKVLYDLGFMEREGSGYDMVYAILLENGKPIPIVKEGIDRVTVVVKKQITNKTVVQLMNKATAEFQLRQKEIITLGLIAQHGSLSALSISKVLNQDHEHGLRSWLGRLPDLNLIQSRGKTRAKQYFVNPEYLRKKKFLLKTSLRSIEDHRLEALIIEDIRSYPCSSFGEIHQRIGVEINQHKIRRLLKKMTESRKIHYSGEKRWRRYAIEQKLLNKTKK